MLALPGNARIFLHQQAMDLRKGFEGLCLMVEELFSQPPTNGAYFVFLNRRRNRMKVLYWDGDGLDENQPLLPGFEPPKKPEEKKKTIPAHERRQPQRNGKDKISLPPSLPLERQIIDLPEEEKFAQRLGRH